MNKTYIYLFFFLLFLMHFLVLDDVASLRKRLAAHQTLVGLLAGVLAHVVEQVPCLVADLAATVVSADQNRVSPHCFFVVDALAFILVALRRRISCWGCWPLSESLFLSLLIFFMFSLSNGSFSSSSKSFWLRCL